MKIRVRIFLNVEFIRACIYIHFTTNAFFRCSGTASAANVAEMTLSMLKLMNVITTSVNMMDIKTPGQQELLVWLAPRLVGLHQLIESSSSASSSSASASASSSSSVTGTPEGERKENENTENTEIEHMRQILVTFIELVLTNITPTLRANYDTASQFKDVLYGGECGESCSIVCSIYPMLSYH